MIVLGFDTATAATAVGLRLADGSTLLARDDPPAGARPGHSAQLLALAAGLLGEAELPWSAIERVAVGLGPGTFTGLRIGAASAQGLARSLGVELVGVSTLHALALAARADHAAVLAVIDARRGEVYAAAYAAARQLTEPRAVAPADLAAVVEQAEGSGAAMGRWLAVGDGAIRFREQLQAAGIAVPEDGSPAHLVSGGAICELALQARPLAAGELLPDYRRRPDAEIALEGARA